MDIEQSHEREIAVAWLNRAFSAPVAAKLRDSFPDPLSKEIVDALVVLAAEFGGKYPRAMAVLMEHATLAYDALALPESALSAHLTRLECLTLEVEGSNGHQLARQAFQHSAVQAAKLECPSLRSRAEARSADCAYFAALAEEDDDDRDTLLRVAALDSLAALHFWGPGRMQGELDQLMSVVAAVTARIPEDGLTGPRALERSALFRPLASALGGAIAPGTVLERTGDAAAHLWFSAAILTAEFGLAADTRRLFDAGRAASPDHLIRLRAATAIHSAAIRSLESAAEHEYYLELARQFGELHRTSFRSRAGRLRAGAQIEKVLGDPVRDLLMMASWGVPPPSQDDADRLFVLGESMKSRFLLDSLASTLQPRDRVPRERELERAVIGLAAGRGDSLVDDELQRASMLAPLDFSSGASIRDSKLEELEELLRENSVGWPATGEVVQPSELAAALEPGEVLIDFFNPFDTWEPSSQLLCAVITHGGVRWVKVPPLLGRDDSFVGRISQDGRAPLDGSPLSNQITQLRLAIWDGEDKSAYSILETLWQLLIDPIVKSGIQLADLSRLIVAPHGVLHLVPWGALSEGSRVLSEIVPVCVVPSLSVWERLVSRQRQPVSRAVVFGDPSVADYDDLPESGAEARSVASRLSDMSVDLRTREHATDAAFLTLVSGAGIVHVACHCDFPDEDALDRHRLVLAPDAKSAGVVANAETLRSTDFSSARLVTLSVCDGATIRFGASDELYGLVPALLTAGAENVLGTLWPISDSAGRQFADAFYANLLTLGPAAAASAAVRTIRAEGAPVREWAAFSLVGPGRPFLLRSDPPDRSSSKVGARVRTQ